MWKSVKEILEKHPPGQTAATDSFLALMALVMTLFCLSSTGDLIKWMAFCTHGVGGLSGVDAYMHGKEYVPPLVQPQ